MDELTRLGLTVHTIAHLKDHTTFRLGGPCQALVECHNSDELLSAVRCLRSTNTPFILMGFGSNILASDKGVDRIVIRYSSLMPLITRDGHMVTVDAATQFDDLASWSVNEGLEGLTAMSGIPGTVGGAIAGNAGAYGQQISDRLTHLTLLKPDGTLAIVSKESINFSYRDSDLKHNGDIILNAVFDLEPSEQPELMQKEREEKLATRGGKHGDWRLNPCAGSFFRNVLPSSSAGQRQAAGWFLEQAGAKDLTVGKAHTYPKHANIVTHDGAQAQDVYDLTLKMSAAVKEKFAFDLVREVRLLGEFRKAPQCNSNGYW